MLDPGNPLRWLGNDPQPLRREGQDSLERKESEPIATFLLSALLRRGFLFATASSLAFRRAAGGDLDIAWCGASTLQTVAARLVDPLAGLPGVGFFVAQRADRLRIASARNDWTVTLGSLPAACGGHGLEPGRHSQARWSAWNEEMARSNVTWSSVITSLVRSVRA